MKNSNIKSIAFSLIVLLMGMTSYAQISKVEIAATGLTCSMCSNAINKQLKSLVEVDSIGTDLNTNTFTVYFKENKEVAPKVLKNAVEKAGFFVGSMIVTAKFDTAKAADNGAVVLNDATYMFIDSKTPAAGGEAKFRILDKGFVTQKEFKKLAKTHSKSPTYSVENENDYHLLAI